MAKKMASRRRTITLTRDGNSIKMKTMFQPDMEYETTLKLNEVIDIKDKEDNPRFHIKVAKPLLSCLHKILYNHKNY